MRECSRLYGLGFEVDCLQTWKVVPWGFWRGPCERKIMEVRNEDAVLLTINCLYYYVREVIHAKVSGELPLVVSLVLVLGIGMNASWPNIRKRGSVVVVVFYWLYRLLTVELWTRRVLLKIKSLAAYGRYDYGRSAAGSVEPTILIRVRFSPYVILLFFGLNAGAYL